MTDETGKKEVDIIKQVLLNHPSLESEIEDIIQHYKLGVLEQVYSSQSTINLVLVDYRHKNGLWDIEHPQGESTSELLEKATIENLLSIFEPRERNILLLYYYFGYKREEVLRMSSITNQEFLDSLRRIKEVFIEIIIPNV